MTNITKVTAETVLKRDGSVKGYKYTAHLDDGSTKVVRGIATRLYDNAFQYSQIVATGKSDLAAYFSFGKNPGGYYKDYVIGSWKVEAA